MSRRETLTSRKNIALSIELARIAKLVPAVVGAVACTDGIGGNADVSSLVENRLHFAVGCCWRGSHSLCGEEGHSGGSKESLEEHFWV